MMRTCTRLFRFLVGIVVCSCFALSGAVAQTSTHLLITNDDDPPGFPIPRINTVSFYQIEPQGSLGFKSTLKTGGNGIGGGYFGANRIVELNVGKQQCIFISEATTGDVVGIAANTETVTGSATGSVNDTGTSNGIGLAMNSQYLFANFTDSSNIGTFQVQPGCLLTFVGDLTVVGLKGGFVDAMAVHGNTLITTYGDGSIESFDISGGIPVSHGDKQFSTAANISQGATYPSSIDITRDGRFAIFGDTSTLMAVEVSDISSGKLAKTVAYQSAGTISASNILLSPDETMLYVSNTQGDRVTALFFNKGTGKVLSGCTSNSLKGYSVNWSYLGSMALQTNTGNGGGLYVAEYGSTSGIAMITMTVSGNTCTLTEAANSPAADPNTTGLLSIGNFPPRSF